MGAENIYGDDIDRVSTILDMWHDKGDALVSWAANLASSGKSWKEERDHAADVGTHTHDMIEMSLRHHYSGAVDREVIAGESLAKLASIPHSMRDEVRLSCMGWSQWADGKNIEPEYVEVKLIDRTMKIGGTPDFIGKINGVRYLLDWKTSKQVYRKHKVQMAAYKYLHDLFRPDEPIERFGVVRLCKRTGVFDDHYWHDLTPEFAVFTSLVALNNAQKAVRL